MDVILLLKVKKKKKVEKPPNIPHILFTAYLKDTLLTYGMGNLTLKFPIYFRFT